jgi:hypothetical protein
MKQVISHTKRYQDQRVVFLVSLVAAKTVTCERNRENLDRSHLDVHF